jgi:hypothetical protein
MLVFHPRGHLQRVISLAGGNGSGAYDIAVGSSGALLVTTGETITRVVNNRASEFGRFGGMFPFPTDIGIAGPSIYVNATFTEVGGLLILSPAQARRPLPAPRGTPTRSPRIGIGR